METEALVDTLAYTAADVVAAKRKEKVVDVKAESPVSALFHTIVEVKATTLGDTVDKEEGKALVFVLADTFAEADAKH